MSCFFKPIFLIIAVVISLQVGAGEVKNTQNAANVEANSDKELALINDEIQMIEAHLEYYRKEAMNAETSAQTYFRYRPNEFIEKEEEHESAEKQVKSLKDRLDSLLARKQQLLSQAPHPKS